MDISEQLSKFRDQTSKPARKDAFGRDVDSRREEKRSHYDRDDDRHSRGHSHHRDKYRDRSGDRDRGRDRDYEDRDYQGSRDRGYCGDYRDKDRRRPYEHRDRNHRDHRDRSWDWDDRDWSRDKDRYSDYNSDPYQDEYERDRYDRGGGGGYDRDGYTRADDLSYLRQEPSDIIMVKNLPPNILDKDIHSSLNSMTVQYKDVRLIRNKYGVSRGFAFVEFPDIKAAITWMEKTHGRVTIGGQLATLSYSKPKVGSSFDRDWVCVKCGTQNFHSKQRGQCFSCETPREESIGDAEKSKDMVSKPCKVLILKGLDTLTTEDTIKKSLAEITALPIYDVRLIRDKITNTSRGFCFVEFGSVQEASQLLEVLTNMTPAFEIDSKQVGAAYAHYSSPPGMKQSMNNSSSDPSSTTATTTTPATIQAAPSAADGAGSHIAANAIAQAQAAAQMGLQGQQAGHKNFQPYQQPAVPGQSDGTNGAVQTPQATVAATSAIATNQTAQPPAGQPFPPTQATLSSYVYDPSTGYYYDSATGLYYDANSGYYYNGTTGLFMYWDVNLQQYVAVANNSAGQAPASTAAAAGTADSANTDDGNSQKDKQKKQKSLSAKKIAKDMERWAKSLNQSKNIKKEAAAAAIAAIEEQKRQEAYQSQPPDFGKKQTTDSDAVLNIVKNFGTLTNVPTTISSPLASLTAHKPATGIVAQYEGDSDEDEADASDLEFADFSRMACLLCKRQFPSKDVLLKHLQFSDLHKQNLEQHKKGKLTEGDVGAIARNIAESKYRDRAKERRELYQQPNKPARPAFKKKGMSEPVEQPTKDGIGNSNIGNQMLKAMGWTEGTGLGKERQGITVPIQASVRSRSAGLGLHGSSYGTTAGDTSKEALKKLALSRYNELD